MKELSIEEKAKRYDEAIKMAKEQHQYSWVRRSMDVLEDIFPELKESEDERIRNAILNHLKKMWGNSQDDVCGVHVEDAIAWLEKQDEQEIKEKPIWKHWKDGIAFGTEGEQIFLIKTGNVYSISSCLGYECDYIELSELDRLLEKQGEKKPFDYENASIQQKDFASIKPKFHEGDWAVSNLDKEARQISEVHFDEYNSYYVVNGKSVNLEEYDRLHHLWTIQDAKDGDVLVVPPIKGSEHSEQIFIFKEIKDREYVKNAVEYYCRCMDNEFASNERGFMGQSDDYFTPATREQRDALLKAMADAGYTFDFEKKEVKKKCVLIGSNLLNKK